MADWDEFTINDYEKVIIKSIDPKKPELRLDVLKLPKRTYFVDKEYLTKLNEYSPETLKDTPIYSLVGTDAGSNDKKGITVEIRKHEKLNGLERFIKEIKEIKDLNTFMMGL